MLLAKIKMIINGMSLMAREKNFLSSRKSSHLVDECFTPFSTAFSKILVLIRFMIHAKIISVRQTITNVIVWAISDGISNPQRKFSTNLITQNFSTEEVAIVIVVKIFC
jgi:hypothetical protein